MSEKKTLEEKIINLEQKQNDWLEPFRNWINSALQAEKIARDNDLFAKKVIAKEIFGSNLILAAREARGRAQNQWAALCAAHKMTLSKPRSQVLVPGAGLEPTRDCSQEILSLSRIPIPPSGRQNFKARTGIAPVYKGFAVPCLKLLGYLATWVICLCKI